MLPDRSSQKGQIIDENAKIKNVNNGQFWLVFEKLMLAVKKFYQTGQFKNGKKWRKMPKTVNLTFLKK